MRRLQDCEDKVADEVITDELGADYADYTDNYKRSALIRVIRAKTLSHKKQIMKKSILTAFTILSLIACDNDDERIVINEEIPTDKEETVEYATFQVNYVAELEQKMMVRQLGTMVDCSRNGVRRVEKIKQFIRMSAPAFR